MVPKFHKMILIICVAFMAMALVYAFMRVANATAAPGRLETNPTPEAPEAALATDLQVRTDVSDETVRPGDVLTFTLRYTNTLPTPVSNVLIEDTIGRGQIFDGQYRSTPEIPPTQYTYSGSETMGYTLRWQLPTLAAYATGEIVFNTRALTTTEPSIDTAIILLGNAVEISSQTQPVSGNSDDAVAMVVGPLLSISKTAPNTVLPGHLLTYTLTIVNNQRADAIAATNLVISDVLPANTTFVSASDTGVYNSETSSVIWNIPGPLQPGGSLTARFTVLVTDRIDSNRSIMNSRLSYRVRCAETLQEVRGTRNVVTGIDPVLIKTAVDRNGGTVAVYPTEEVTYTITVHNPLPDPLYGVVVTDTLPGVPDPFTYLRPTAGSPAPTVVNGGRTLVWVVDLPGWGSITRSFVVQIPRNTYIPDNRTNTTYTNQLSAAHPATYFCPEDNLAAVRVDAALVLNKVVNPTHAMNGDPVTYALTLENRGPFVVSNIRLTDTLPANFHYLRMDVGPQPLQGYRYNPVVWSALQVAREANYTMSFVAEVDGVWLETYYNRVCAYSPDVYIPCATREAPVRVDPPLTIDKTVEPTTAYLGSSLTYNLSLSNRSDVSWSFDQILDDLPDGFYQVGGSWGNVAALNFNPPINLPPGGTWTGSFNASISDVNCSVLPRAYPNASGAIQVHFTSPMDLVAVNDVNLAPVTVQPNIQVELTPYRRVVQPGDTFTYTLVLRNVSNAPAINSTINLTLPTGFTYLNTLQGQAPTVNGQQLTWQGVNINPGAEVRMVFRVQVSLSISLGTKTPTFSATANGVCFGRLGSGLTSGQVVVDDYVVVFTKTPSQQRIPPMTLVDFVITIDNNDQYPFRLAAITDTLPAGFTYYAMVSGPSPTLVQAGKVVWRDVLIPAGVTRWTIRLQSAPLYGSYYNKIWAVSPETVIVTGTHTNAVQVLPLFDLKKDAAPGVYFPGMVVPYTITLVNQSDTQYNNILITDTLPTGFRYYRSRPGYPTPIALGPNASQPVWNIPTLRANCGAAGCTARIAFDALVAYWAPVGRYTNQVIGSSPSGSIPGPINTAPVTLTTWNTAVYLPFVRR